MITYGPRFLFVALVNIFESVEIVILGSGGPIVGVSEFMTEEFSQLNLKEASRGI
jgi:hypothetical protein